MAIDMYDIYSTSHSNAWRFTLGKSGQGKLLTIGLNPSTATAEKSDTTIAKVQTVAQRNGFDGFVMLNLYPIRATDCRALPQKVNQLAFTENIRCIESIVASEREPTIWAAWGQNILARSFFADAFFKLLIVLGKHGVTWQRLGTLTTAGHPRHPSRIHYEWDFAPLDIENYADTLRK